MRPALSASIVIVAAVLLLMLVELQLSLFNERSLRAKGAIEPPDDVIRWMRIAYPGAFVLMGLEAAAGGPLSRNWVIGGLLLFGWAKALKFWAIAHLGSRWTFRVLVLPGAPLVSSGPYKYLRHPNYVGVLGELIAVAIALQAPVIGAVATLGFSWLLWRRIQVEERALTGHTSTGP
jgi:methyltransferase